MGRPGAFGQVKVALAGEQVEHESGAQGRGWGCRHLWELPGHGWHSRP